MKDEAPVQEPWKYRRWNDGAEKWELTDDCGWPSEPVYTTPPAAQRQWVGLTGEEVYLNCPNWLSHEQCKTWVQQIEAKLKEKNYG
jgi:hypothetical protein